MENAGNDSDSLNAQKPDDQLMNAEKSSSWAIALSGGGLRATLFELGILLYFALTDEIKNVRGVVSVSGGSILSAHLALNWQRATRNLEGFIEVASELVAFSRQDIRNRALIRWMWWHVPLVTFLFPSFRNIHFLKKQYNSLYGTKTLQDLSRSDDFPKFAFVTTDPIQQRRVAFTRDHVWRIKFDGTLDGDKILAKGTPISLAVAASSCFPPVFSRLKATNEELRLTWKEFPGTLLLTDGGVSGNLGIEVLICLIENDEIHADRLLVCDAESGVLREPKDNLNTITNAIFAALSESGRQKLAEFAPNSKECAIVTRGPEEFDLRTGAMTSVAGYRTDLDRPSWDECFALIVHGAVVAHQQLGAEFGRQISPETIRDAVQGILKRAGCQNTVPEPKDDALRNSNRRRFGRIIFHGILIVLVYAAISEFLSAYVWPGLPRPYSYAIRQSWPEPVVERDLDSLLLSLTRATCADSKARSDGDSAVEIPKLKSQLEGSLSQIDITVGQGSSSTTLKVVEDRQLPECERVISCQVTFRGSFPRDLHKANTKATVTGRIVNVDGKVAYAYIDLEGCWAKPTQ